MLFEIGDWSFEVDVPMTMSLSMRQAAEHCDCGYCRNFYAAVDSSYPHLRQFLAEFGICIEAPDELCPFEPTIYETSYILQGQIVRQGSIPIYIDGLPLTIKKAESADLDTEHPFPYFVFCIGLMELPWVLEESMEDVISPANESDYMARMERKLLERVKSTELLS